jgi:hypothetical protein
MLQRLRAMPEIPDVTLGQRAANPQRCNLISALPGMKEARMQSKNRQQVPVDSRAHHGRALGWQ